MKIEELLQSLDHEIERYHRKHQIIISELGDQGRIEQKYSLEYHKRQKKIWNEYEDRVSEILQQLDLECKRAREGQPLLDRLDVSSVFDRKYIPRRLVIGSSVVDYESFHEKVPRTVEFPISCPIFATAQMEQRLNQIFLRLLFSIPPGKVTYYIFDPHGLGQNMAIFSPLFKQTAIFPYGGVIYRENEIKEILQKLQEEAVNRMQNIFPAIRGCHSWADYNRKMIEEDRISDMLDYKVIVFWGLSEALNQDVLRSVISLADVGASVGMLLVYSCDNATIQSLVEHHSSQETTLSTAEIMQYAIHVEMNPYHNTMKNLVAQSVQIEKLAEKLSMRYSYQYLQISEIDEPMPSKEYLWDMLQEYKQLYTKYANEWVDFDHIIRPSEFWKENAAEKLSIPVGHLSVGGTAIVGISDVPNSEYDIACHYLMGGATGSGKSNLLHDIILSAAFRYSPEELLLYLMDLKDGVEFKVYAKGKLPQARLVALKADENYGYSILEHLEEERIRRNEVLFHQANVSDYKEYRKQNKLPRILLIIDEFQRLLENPKVIPLFTKLLRLGRSSGIHILLATQTLKGLDNFSNLQSQFGGRIVLKCSNDEDSQMLFGGYASGNTAAALLQTHHAILNTNAGRTTANRDFLVPKAPDSNERLEIVKEMANLSEERKMTSANLRIYDGDRIMTVPEKESFKHHDVICLTLGIKQDFEESPFCVKFENRMGNNILFCGNEKPLLLGLKEALLMSADRCKPFDEIVYIGKYDITHNLDMQKDFLVYSNLKEFLADNRDLLASKRLLLLDRVNCIEYRNGTSTSDDAKKFKIYTENMNEQGSMMVAFYDTYAMFRESGFKLDFFRHIIGFGLNNLEYVQLLNASVLPKVSLRNKAIYGYNGELEVFKPFIEILDSEDSRG